MRFRSEEQDVFLSYKKATLAFVDYLSAYQHYKVDNKDPMWKQVRKFMRALEEVEPVTSLCVIDLEHPSMEKNKQSYDAFQVKISNELMRNDLDITKKMEVIAGLDEQLEDLIKQWNKSIKMETQEDPNKQEDPKKIELQNTIEKYKKTLEEKEGKIIQSEEDKEDIALLKEEITRRENKLKGLSLFDGNKVRQEIMKNIVGLAKDKAKNMTQKEALKIKKESLNKNHEKLSPKFNPFVINTLSQMVFFNNILESDPKIVSQRRQEAAKLEEIRINFNDLASGLSSTAAKKRNEKASRKSAALTKRFLRKDRELTKEEQTKINAITLDMDKLAGKGENQIVSLLMSKFLGLNPTPKALKDSIKKLKDSITAFKKEEPVKYNELYNQLKDDPAFSVFHDLKFLNTKENDFDYSMIKSFFLKVQRLHEFHHYAQGEQYQDGQIIIKLDALKDSFITELRKESSATQDQLKSVKEIEKEALSSIEKTEKMPFEKALIEIKKIHTGMDTELRKFWPFQSASPKKLTEHSVPVRAFSHINYTPLNYSGSQQTGRHAFYTSRNVSPTEQQEQKLEQQQEQPEQQQEEEPGITIRNNPEAPKGPK
jgi:hypothetical protein